MDRQITCLNYNHYVEASSVIRRHYLPKQTPPPPGPRLNVSTIYYWYSLYLPLSVHQNRLRRSAAGPTENPGHPCWQVADCTDLPVVNILVESNILAMGSGLRFSGRFYMHVPFKSHGVRSLQIASLHLYVLQVRLLRVEGRWDM